MLLFVDEDTSDEVIRSLTCSGMRLIARFPRLDYRKMKTSLIVTDWLNKSTRNDKQDEIYLGEFNLLDFFTHINYLRC